MKTPNAVTVKPFNLDGIDRVCIRQALVKFGYSPEAVAAVDNAVNAHEELVGFLKTLSVRISETKEPHLYRAAQEAIRRAEGGAV